MTAHPQNKPADDAAATGAALDRIIEQQKQQHSADREELKAARAALQALLASFLDLHLPGHGDKESVKLTKAIDALIIARTRGSDMDGLQELIADQIKERCPTLDQIESMVDKFLARQLDSALAKLKIPSLDDVATIAEAKAKKTLDDATAPADETKKKGNK